MTPNQQTIARFMDGFNNSDHAAILACLTDDIVWVMPGTFQLAGKVAFDKEIENDAFIGSPHITVTRMIEENDAVVAEGTVTSARSEGRTLNAVFCDVFLMRDARIHRLTSYLMEVLPGTQL
ncbi:MAG TPA: nuclear transport factor 2 family protein [Terriglobales bacterium]|nr:nuclear transport factor 2 family protein [Terriglobales bacterium]